MIVSWHGKKEHEQKISLATPKVKFAIKINFLLLYLITGKRNWINI